MSEMLRDEKFGMRAIINAMNDWLNEFSQRDNFTLVRYEALRASPAEHFRDLLAVLGESAPDAIRFSRTHSSFPASRTCKSWRPPGRLIQTSCIRVMCAIQSRSKCAAGR